MDPINIIAGLNLILTLGANLPGAKMGLKSTVTVAKEKPKTYLQNIPMILSTIILAAFILGIFKIGTLTYSDENFGIRILGLSLFMTFSWIQIWAYKSLGNNY